MEDAWGIVTEKLNTWKTEAVELLPNVVLAILVLIAFWLLAKLAKKVVRKVLEKLTDSAAVVSMASAITSFVVLAIGTFFALGLLQLDKTVTSLLAGAGVVGLALAFAFQDSAANLVAGVLLSFRQPFRVGDLIESHDVMGRVQDINLRTTVVRGLQGQMIFLPNKDVLETKLVNFDRSGERRVDLVVGVSYGDDLDQARQIALDAIEQVPGRQQGREAELFYTGFGASSIDFTLRFWLPETSQPAFLEARSQAIMAIKSAFDKEGITIPFPIRTLDFGIVGGQPLGQVLEPFQSSQAASGEPAAS